MFVIKNRQSRVTGTVTVTATVHEGSYTANDDGEGDADHEYRVTGKARLLSGIEFRD